ncbi:bifunctional folylpolyglutamate synthase/dihydrofolate synthase [Floccifex sp.]|uniref:bifunctional folylpolyglutamate synthase/dihydrofolate synthase n=1 Tax=Floccifex sp. TaxID=2815810 RepID=UPI002A748734|nr:Mur ligase family protein [Floccifex sp.]MDD7281638.1 Mur ligase family protein [Erysipelotrichaceae bacterium]MDY2958753.1 Mur ligase family protein [Floccifex sp.]
MNVEQKIEKMESCRGKNHDLLLYREWLNEYLPDHKAVSKIQVGGTNGKGSTCQWLQGLLKNSGFKVGVFTSPHLISHFERIVVNNEMISSVDWERIYDQYEPLFNEKQMTMFEMDLWMALAYFLEQEVDVMIMEVGMGGRLDATTALDYSATLITNVGMDHQQYLGDCIEQIAYEKSGIFKPGVLALTTEKKENCQRVMEQVASIIMPMLGFVSLPYQQDGNKISFEWNEHTYYMNLPYYQVDNLALALECLFALGVELKPEVIQKTIDEFNWLGRFTQLKRDYRVILDGAHNVDGIRSLVNSVKEWKGSIYFSALSDKDVKEMLDILNTLHCPITLVHIDSYRAYDLDSLHYPVISKEELIKKINNPSEDMLVCGSLYFMGEILEKVKD